MKTSKIDLSFQKIDNLESAAIDLKFIAADSILFYCFYCHHNYPLKNDSIFLKPSFGVQVQTKYIIEKEHLYKRIIEDNEIIEILNCLSNYKEIEIITKHLSHQAEFAAIIYNGNKSDTLSYLNPALILNSKTSLIYDKNPLDMLLAIFGENYILCDLKPQKIWKIK